MDLKSYAREIIKTGAMAPHVSMQGHLNQLGGSLGSMASGLVGKKGKGLSSLFSKALTPKVLY